MDEESFYQFFGTGKTPLRIYSKRGFCVSEGTEKNRCCPFHLVVQASIPARLIAKEVGII